MIVKHLNDDIIENLNLIELTLNVVGSSVKRRLCPIVRGLSS